MRMLNKNAGIKGVSPTKEVLRRLVKDKVAILGLVIFTLEILIAVFGPLLVKADPYEMNFSETLLAPCKEHILGTDDLGRDIFSRIVMGARYSLGLGLSVVMFSTLIGTIIGSIVGYFGGVVDLVVMRICDIFQSIPPLLMSVAISAALGQGFFNTLIALSLGSTIGTVRLLRGSIMKIRSEEFLEAADLISCSKFRTIVTHVLPNSFSPVIVRSTMGIANAIMSASTLSFIGLGIQQPTPEWGGMLSGARKFMRKCPWMIIYPGLAIAITVLALNLLGDGLRDAMDPKMKD